MKCDHVDKFLDPDMQEPCPNDVVWNQRCKTHGGVHPTIPELMTLLAALTGWSDQSLSVEIGFKRARTWTAQDESHLDERSRGFVASTKIVCLTQVVGAQGIDLPTALWALCEEVVKKVDEAHRRSANEATKARDAIAMFVAARIREQAR